MGGGGARLRPRSQRRRQAGERPASRGGWLPWGVAVLCLVLAAGWAVLPGDVALVVAAAGLLLPLAVLLALLAAAAVGTVRSRRRIVRARSLRRCGSPAAAVCVVPERAPVEIPTSAAPATPTLRYEMIAGTEQRRLDVENEQEVLEWRLARLRAAGYPETFAAELAGRADIDLHLAERLVEQGCPPDLALSILW